eukprot:319392_1
MGLCHSNKNTIKPTKLSPKQNLDDEINEIEDTNIAVNETECEYEEDEEEEKKEEANSTSHNELTKESLETYSNLINMGFDEELSMKAVTKYGNNINKCTDFIISNTQGSKNQSKPKTKQKSKLNTFQERLDEVLRINEEIESNNGIESKVESNIYDIIKNKIYKQYDGINGFIRDYSHFVERIDKDKIYKNNINGCNISKCNNISRNFRDKNIYDTNVNERKKLYKNCETETQVIIQQIIDIIHISQYHLVDIGLRSDDNKGIKQSDQKRMQDLMETRLGFSKIRKDINNNNMVYASNKFVTEIFDDKKQEMDNDDSKYEHKQKTYPEYSSGIRFYYHTYYKHKKEREEILPGTDMYERGNMDINADYTYSTWFIKAKHKSIKEEVLEGKKVKLSMIEYENVINKTNIKFKALRKTIKGARFWWEVVYKIKRNSPITQQHILSIILYTDFDDLQREFTRSFRKLSSTETDEELKDRHSEWANWAKAMREAVEVWGTPFGEAPS